MKSFIEALKSSLQAFYSLSEADLMVYSLLEKFCSVSKMDILLNKNFSISASQEENIRQAVEDLKKYKPLQYVLGEAFFCGDFFEVNEAVLIPRPETEELVAIVSDTLEKNYPQAKILDIGTGSGCIAISLALALPQAQITALDVSEKALNVAQRNAKKMNVQVNFIQKDALCWQNEENLTWDCIVSNPPYICEKEKSTMEENVLLYEPATALFVPDTQALIFYEKIAEIAKKSLRSGGLLFFEINEKFGEELALMLQEKGFEQVEILKDFYGKDRFVKTQKN